MKYYGLIGGKLSHSLSPVIHKFIFDAIGIVSDYELFAADSSDVESKIRSLKSDGLCGLNVTIPYKKSVMAYLDEISYEAKRIGAVNTVVVKDTKLEGYNTDYFGFKAMLEHYEVEIVDKKVYVLGTGGSANSVVAFLLDSGVKKVTLVSRNLSTNSNFANEVEIIDYNELKNHQGDVLVNTTPVGMYPNISECAVGDVEIKNFSTLVDLIYNPEETVFLQKGRILEKKTVGGLYMLVAQAVKAQEIWQNRPIDKKIITNIYNQVNQFLNHEDKLL